MPSIREVEPERDAAGIVALIREAAPDAVITPQSWLHRVRSIPERARPRGFVADEDGIVVGNGYAFFDFFARAPAAAFCFAVVARSHRRRGVGRELHRLAAEHARSAGATRLLAQFHESAAGVAFARAHGYREARAEALSELDPRRVRDRPPSDVELVPIAAADPRQVYEVDFAASHDVPATEPFEQMPYEEWERHVLEHPLFTPEGSFGAIVDGTVVAASFLTVDRESGRASNMFTGTLPAYRERGLARAAKLAVIEWAAANGVTRLTTTNDERNAPMLAVNRRLGYRPAGRRVEYLAELG
jgi:GNAT superfamily N-acetyltransferase